MKAHDRIREILPIMPIGFLIQVRLWRAIPKEIALYLFQPLPVVWQSLGALWPRGALQTLWPRGTLYALWPRKAYWPLHTYWARTPLLGTRVIHDDRDAVRTAKESQSVDQEASDGELYIHSATSLRRITCTGTPPVASIRQAGGPRASCHRSQARRPAPTCRRAGDGEAGKPRLR